MKLKREEFKKKLLDLFGEEPTDEQLSVIDDYVDTFEKEEDDEEWKKKYEELDKNWRRRYKERFLGRKEKKDEEDEEDKEKTKYEELFEEV